MSLTYFLPMESLPWQVTLLIDIIAGLHVLAFSIACYLWFNDILKLLFRGKIVDDRPDEIRRQSQEIKEKWQK